MSVLGGFQQKRKERQIAKEMTGVALMFEPGRFVSRKELEELAVHVSQLLGQFNNPTVQVARCKMHVQPSKPTEQ